MRYWVYILPVVLACAACGRAKVPEVRNTYAIDAGDSVVPAPVPPVPDTATVHANDSTAGLANNIVSFAETLVGVPYRYSGTDPATGFDCSGFITYVFQHFRIPVPRSSIDFTNEGTDVLPEHARRGDLVLFTGTDSMERAVGHMGIVTANRDGEISFIHSTSGKAYGVTITPLNEHYKRRFVKVIRVLP